MPTFTYLPGLVLPEGAVQNPLATPYADARREVLLTLEGFVGADWPKLARVVVELYSGTGKAAAALGSLNAVPIVTDADLYRAADDAVGPDRDGAVAITWILRLEAIDPAAAQQDQEAATGTFSLSQPYAGSRWSTRAKVGAGLAAAGAVVAGAFALNRK